MNKALAIFGSIVLIVAGYAVWGAMQAITHLITVQAVTFR